MASGGWTTTTFSHFFLVPLNYEVGNVIALFRTAKLIRGTSGHKYIRPKAILDPEIVEEYSKDYIYFACIAFINSAHLSPSSLSAVDVDAVSLIQIKTASLQWHSPMLNDISAVSLLLHLFSSWSFPLYFAGKNMGQSQKFRHAQNVPCRSPQQAPSNLTHPLRLIPPLRRASAASASACYISSIRAFHVLEAPDITYGAWGPRARI